MKTEHLLLGAVAVAAIGWVLYDDLSSGQDSMIRGSASRHVTGPSIRGTSLDVSCGQVTPDHLLWFGPTMRPAGWVPHRMRYPALPGQNLEILMNGAPMASVTSAVPRSLRGWMFEPPAEVDY